MATTQVTDSSFESEVLKSDGPVVVDFWADWCHPCEHIDTLLRELARHHPELAVRRVEVPSGDTPVAREHLSDDQTLPQVWIYDAQGERVERLVASLRVPLGDEHELAALRRGQHKHAHYAFAVYRE